MALTTGHGKKMQINMAITDGVLFINAASIPLASFLVFDSLLSLALL